MRQVYLDHQSATPLLPEVLEAMQPFFAASFGNPSSPHEHGLRARDALAKVIKSPKVEMGIVSHPPVTR